MLTVTTFLESRDALALLLDARVLIATRDITDKGGRRSREEVGACLDVLVVVLVVLIGKSISYGGWLAVRTGSTHQLLIQSHIYTN